MAYNTDGMVGVNFDVTTAGTTTDGANAEFPLRTLVNATDGQMYMYVQAAEAITQYDFVAIDENGQMSQLTTTEADDGWDIGVAQVAFSDNDLGWVAVKGANLTGRVAASCGKDVAIYTTTTGGVVDDATTTTKLAGVVVVADNSLTVTASKEVLLTWPRSSGF